MDHHAPGNTSGGAAPASPSPGPDVRAELARLIDQRLIVSRYQPIVHLESGHVAGFEALARGPQGSPLAFPDRMFAAASALGMTDDLDAACRAAALRGAAQSAIAGAATLFVNTEPESSEATMGATYASLRATGPGAGVVFEFTERALTLRPADVLAATRRLRRLGGGIALDDVGIDSRSLALLPFVEPDVIKLDLSIVQGPRTPHAARVMHAVGAHAERTGAAIIAEGIEDDRHLAVARSLGATHGQGWHFGRPDDPPATLGPTVPFTMREQATVAQGQTPFTRALAAGRPIHIASKGLLLSLSQQLELQAMALGQEGVVLGNLQNAHHLTPATARRYERLAEITALAGLIGHGVGGQPGRGVRGGSYGADDPLRQEWSVAVLGPHFSGALLARDLGDELPDLERRFEYCLTYDRALVAGAARTLMAAIASC